LNDCWKATFDGVIFWLVRYAATHPEPQSNCSSGRSSPDCRHLPESLEHLPAQPIAQRQPAVHLILVLSEQAILRRRSAHVWTGYREVQRSWRTLQKITEGIAGESWLKDEAAKIIRSKRRSKALQIEVPHSADIDSSLQGMFTESVGQVIAELRRLRLCDPGLVPPNRSQPGTGAEVECRKCVCR